MRTEHYCPALNLSHRWFTVYLPVETEAQIFSTPPWIFLPTPLLEIKREKEAHV